MTHYSKVLMIVVDVPPEVHDAELAFWQAATGANLSQLERHPEYHGGELPGTGLSLLVQRLGEGPARFHVDIHTDNLEAEVARLEALGAQQLERLHFWCVLRDPAGLLVCVVEEPAGSLDDTNAQRWE